MVTNILELISEQVKGFAVHKKLLVFLQSKKYDACYILHLHNFSRIYYGPKEVKFYLCSIEESNIELKGYKNEKLKE